MLPLWHPRGRGCCRPGNRRCEGRAAVYRLRHRAFVNPTLVEGQLVGGAAQGLVGRCSRSLSTTRAGNRWRQALRIISFRPRAICRPVRRHAGDRGCAEPDQSAWRERCRRRRDHAVGAAIANAVDDALGRPVRAPSTGCHCRRHGSLGILKRLRR